MNNFKAIFLVASLSLPAVAEAHSFWLEPANYRVNPPAEIGIAFRVGDATDIESWELRWDRVVSLTSFTNDEIIDHQANIRPSSDSEPGGATIRAAHPGPQILAFASQASFSDLTVDKFNANVAEDELTLVSKARESAGTVNENGTQLYSRCAKASIQVGNHPTDNALHPIGQTLEIVPQRLSYAMGEDRALPVKVLFRGQPLEGGLVELIDLIEPVARHRTDSSGVTTFEIPNMAHGELT